MNKDLPSGWALDGQMEKGEEGTPHFQGMLRTPKVAFSTVKRYFPRAHIEKARAPQALAKYVHKQETRLAEFTQKNRIPTIFEFQKEIIQLLPTVDEVNAQWKARVLAAEEHPTERRKIEKLTIDDHFMEVLDKQTNVMIEDGIKGIEFIAINPMWRSSWKRFWKPILNRTEEYTDASVQDEDTLGENGEVHSDQANSEDEEDEEDGETFSSDESGSEETDSGDGGDEV